MMRIDLSDEYQSRDPDAKNNCRKIGQEPMLARHEKCHDNADRNEEKKRYHRQQGNDDLNGLEYFDYSAVIADCVAGLFHGLLLFYPSRLAR